MSARRITQRQAYLRPRCCPELNCSVSASKDWRRRQVSAGRSLRSGLRPRKELTLREASTAFLLVLPGSDNDSQSLPGIKSPSVFRNLLSIEAQRREMCPSILIFDPSPADASGSVTIPPGTVKTLSHSS